MNDLVLGEQLRENMGIFEKIMLNVSGWLAAPDQSRMPELDDEAGHLQLLLESANRAAAAHEAIDRGDLVAALSTTESESAAKWMRYHELSTFAATQRVTVGAVGTKQLSQHTGRVTSKAAASSAADISPSAL